MSAKAFVLCLLMVATFNQPTVGHNNMTLWRKYCPSNKYCTPETPNNNTNMAVTNSCCSNCSCDENCWLLDNCCPDVLHEKPDNLRAPRCINGMINHNYFYFLDNLHKNKYWMIALCPHDYDASEREVIERCLGTLKDKTTFDDELPVMDNDGRLYKNIFCAICHGVLNFERWDLTLIRCRVDVTSQSIVGSRYVKTILDNCMLQAVPTEKMMRERILRRCFKSDVSSCESGENGGRSDIRHECLNGRQIPFLINNEQSVRYYKNVFCYMCDHDDTVISDCRTPDGMLPGKSLFFDSSIMLLDISIVDDIREHSDMTSHPECDDTDMYDGVEDKCHRLYCPQYYIVSHGRCLKMGTLYDGYGVRLQIHYAPVDDITVAVTPPNDGKALQNTLLKDYELEECNVTFFNIIGFIDVNDDRLASVRVYIELLFDKVCSMDDTIILIKRKLSKNNITLEYGHMQINLIGGLSFNGESYAYDRNQLRVISFIHGLGKVITSGEQIQIKSLYGFFLCPYFVINADKYKPITEPNTSITLPKYTRMREGIYALTNDTFAVCVDAYFELLNSSQIVFSTSAPIVVSNSDTTNSAPTVVSNSAQTIVSSNSLSLLVVMASVYYNLFPRLQILKHAYPITNGNII